MNPPNELSLPPAKAHLSGYTGQAEPKRTVTLNLFQGLTIEQETLKQVQGDKARPACPP